VAVRPTLSLGAPPQSGVEHREALCHTRGKLCRINRNGARHLALGASPGFFAALKVLAFAMSTAQEPCGSRALNGPLATRSHIRQRRARTLLIASSPLPPGEVVTRKWSDQDQAVSRPSDVKSRQDATRTTRRSQQVSHPTPLARLPGQEKSGISLSAIFPRSGATSAHPIDPTSITAASTNHRHYLVAPPASGSWLGTTRRTIGAACRGDGEKLVHGTRHRCGTDRRERGSQPESGGPTLAQHAGQTRKLGPRSSGDRASVS
jgi:hypothetical protein